MRVVLGGLVGMALVVGGLRLGRAGYDAYGQVLTGGGLAVLYLAIYAAFGFYGLIGSGVAFALLTTVTVGAALLAARQDSQPMAVMAIGGGFLTPFLVGGTTDAQVTLFSYVILLVLGTLYLARRRAWPWLNVFSYALTIVTVAAWADAYYAGSKYFPRAACSRGWRAAPSSRTRSAPLTSARAIAVRCCWPPESCNGVRLK